MLEVEKHAVANQLWIRLFCTIIIQQIMIARQWTILATDSQLLRFWTLQDWISATSSSPSLWTGVSITRRDMQPWPRWTPAQTIRLQSQKRITTRPKSSWEVSSRRAMLTLWAEPRSWWSACWVSGNLMNRSEIRSIFSLFPVSQQSIMLWSFYWIDNFPGHAGCYHLLGFTLYVLNELEDALSLLEIGSMVDPNYEPISGMCPPHLTQATRSIWLSACHLAWTTGSRWSARSEHTH